MADGYNPPPTRLLSWEQMCLEADPGFRRSSNQPWTYQFSNGRRFYEAQPIYGSPYMMDDSGNIMRDDFGNPMQADSGVSAGTPSTPGTGGFPFGQGAFGTDGF